MAKPAIEFRSFDDMPWVQVEGYPPEFQEKILARDPVTGDVTRLFRSPPGAGIESTLSHDFWEEIYILEGDLIRGDNRFTKGMYACRPPGMLHGRCLSPQGCMSLEVRYYPRRQKVTGMAKPANEFRSFDDVPWVQVAGYPPGFQEKILARDPVTGDVTRLFRTPPGARTESTLSHDFWEEIYILEGELANENNRFTEGMYACRPPGMLHGPYSSSKGCMSFEVRYYL
jgi:hypothetical protein